MCGIAGIIANKEITVEQIKTMTDTMLQRGPDADGHIILKDKEQFIALGHRRLKIIDLSDSANQPFLSDDKNISLVFNGEIYNYLELKDTYLADEVFHTASDTEVILKLYQKLGIDFVPKLRGMFALAIYDRKISTLYLIRDHLGKKPLFFAHNPEGLMFASTLQAITSQVHTLEINKPILLDYLNYNYIPTNQTVYKNIYKLPPASILQYQNGRIDIKKYWELDFNTKTKDSAYDIFEKTENLIRESVRLRLVSDVPLGAFLSGGVDSGLIVALMAEYLPKVKTFSIGFEQADFNELKYAKLTAEKYNTEHTEFIVKPNFIEIIDQLIQGYDEPFADPSIIPSYYLAKLTRQKVTVALNGDGGDECFAGYERYLGATLLQKYRHMPIILRQGLAHVLKPLKENIAHRSALRRIKWFNEASLSDPEQAYLNIFRKIYFQDSSAGDQEFLNYYNIPQDSLDKMLNADINTYLPQDLLVKADRATMQHSLEGRSPLLDVRLMEYCASIPSKYKLNKTTSKYILKKISEKYLPKEIINRPKQGFGVPLGSWFRNELKDYLENSLHSCQIHQQGILSQEKIDIILHEHLSGKNNHGRLLFNLLILEKWFNAL